MAVNMTTDVLEEVMDVLADQARHLGCNVIRAGGLDPKEGWVKRWIEIGARIESNTKTRKTPVGWCWYGPEQSRGELVGCELWAMD